MAFLYQWHCSHLVWFWMWAWDKYCACLGWNLRLTMQIVKYTKVTEQERFLSNICTCICDCLLIVSARIQPSLFHYINYTVCTLWECWGSLAGFNTGPFMNYSHQGQLLCVCYMIVGYWNTLKFFYEKNQELQSRSWVCVVATCAQEQWGRAHAHVGATLSDLGVLMWLCKMIVPCGFGKGRNCFSPHIPRQITQAPCENLCLP